MEGFLDDKEFFKALAVKVCYEAAARDLTGSRKKFNVDELSHKGRVNLDHFKEISRKLQVMEVTVEDFIGVMFNHYKWPRKMAGRLFNYPYLSFLASDGAMSMFRRGYRELKSSYGHIKMFRRVIRSGEGGSLEIKFGGCFYTGFDYLYSAVEQFGFAYFERPINLLSFFFANNEMFSPEFICLHKSFRKMLKQQESLLGVERKLAHVICEYVSAVRRRARTDNHYHRRLGRAYRAVREKEGGDIEKQRKNLRNWKRVWLLLR